MKIQLKAITAGMKTREEWLAFSRACGRVCYTDKDFDMVLQEEDKSGLIERTLKSGHHSLFEHINLTFYLSGIPKILGMILNNERQYATSEKSARYTQMSGLPEEQKQLYDKWMAKLIPLIAGVYPKMADEDQRAINIKKLAQENARYMTSVFTPTKMVHTLNLRQLNFIMVRLGGYAGAKRNAETEFERRIAGAVPEFLDQLGDYRIEGLENQTDRHLSMFNFEDWNETFADVYSTSYVLSFAGLAQAQRHRTIAYNMKMQEGPTPTFFVPPIVETNEIAGEWLADLKGVAKTDYPQAQLVEVRERGLLEDFRSKCILRLCGHAQQEIMTNTYETAQRYAEHVPAVANWMGSKCSQGMKCASPCVWGSKRALERIV